MRRCGPTLPGAPRAKALLRYRDPADRMVVVDRDAVRRQILAAIADGPKAKWEIREAIHIAEQVIYKELQALRVQGVVKAVGKRFTDRKWAIASWQPAPTKGLAPIYPDEQTAIRTKKPEPAKDSWWTRPEFRYPGKGANA